MALGDNARGALIMMVSMAALTFGDASMKLLSAEMPLFQAMALRGGGMVLVFSLISYKIGALRHNLSRRDWGLVGLRSVAEVAAAYFFLTALFNMPLANASAILQVLPLSTTLAGAALFREPLGWRRMAAIVVGFGGVLLIVRPGTEGFNEYSLMALASVGCVTLRDLATRRMSAAVPSMMVALSASVAVTAFAIVASFSVDWVPVSAGAAAILSGTVLFLILAYLTSVAAMRTGELSFVVPFRYSGLLWSLVLGLVVFGDWPSNLTLFGAFIVVATGIFTFFRERKLARAASLRPRPRR